MPYGSSPQKQATGLRRMRKISTGKDGRDGLRPVRGAGERLRGDDMKPHIIPTAEIAMLLMMSEQFIDATKGKGRLKNMLKRLQKASVKEVQRMPKLTDNDKDTVRDLVVEFGRVTKWDSKPLHFITHISFFLAMVEASDHPYRDEMFDVLNSLVEYYDRANDHKILCDGRHGFRKVAKNNKGSKQ